MKRGREVVWVWKHSVTGKQEQLSQSASWCNTSSLSSGTQRHHARTGPGKDTPDPSSSRDSLSLNSGQKKKNNHKRHHLSRRVTSSVGIVAAASHSAHTHKKERKKKKKIHFPQTIWGKTPLGRLPPFKIRIKISNWNLHYSHF